MRSRDVLTRTVGHALLCVLLCALAFLLPNCNGNFAKTPTRQVAADQEVLTNQTCQMPCWRGIIPGQTGKDEFMKLVRQNNITPNALEQYPVGSGTVIGWPYPNESNRGGAVFISANIVQVLDLDAVSGIRLAEVVKQFGEPNKIQTGSGLFGEHQSGYDVRAYYPQRGLVFHFAMELLPKDNLAGIHPNLVVDQISLFPPGSADEIVSVAKEFEGPTTLTNIYSLPLQNWRGYTDYEILPLR